MKTETQIAEDNLKDCTSILDISRYMASKWKCEGHKASCQRDIPKLEKIKENVVYVENELTHHLIDEMINDKKRGQT